MIVGEAVGRITANSAGAEAALVALGETIRRMAEVLEVHGGEFQARMRGHHCGPRNRPGPAFTTDQGQEVLEEHRAHRRAWRRCKRYYTQTKQPPLPRGGRRLG